MTKLTLTHNPYTVSTTLIWLDGDEEKPIGAGSVMEPILHARLLHWAEPYEGWKGFFPVLSELFGEKNFEIAFAGVEEDFNLLRDARDRHATPAGIVANLTFLSSVQQTRRNSNAYKMEQVQELYEEVRRSAIGSDERLIKVFEQVLGDEFDINVMAPVSAGKSTLQNALIGKRNLPTSNDAKTAIIARTRIDPGLAVFHIRPVGADEAEPSQNWISPVTQELVNEFNDKKNPEDIDLSQDLQRAFYRCLQLEGPIFRSEHDATRRFDQGPVRLVLVDTPGGNNAMNEEHREIARRIIEDEEKSMVLFVFSANTIDHSDTRNTLQQIADAMRRSQNGQLSQDRFLFVCTGADQITENYRDEYNRLKGILAGFGITQPHLYLVCSLAAELIRTCQRNDHFESSGIEGEFDELTERDWALYDHFIASMSQELRAGDSKRRMKQSKNQDPALYHFSSLPLSAQCAFDAEKQRIRAQYDRGEIKQETAQQLIVLINSGVPALEYTIAEYIDRYAIPIKIRLLHDALKRYAADLKLRERSYEEWSTSEASYRAAKAEVERKEAIYNRSVSIQKTLDTLDPIQFNENRIIQRQSHYLRRLREDSQLSYADVEYMHMTVNGIPGEYAAIRRDRVDQYIALQKMKIENVLQQLSEEIVDTLNRDVVEQCNILLSKYRDCLKALKDDGLFDLAGMHIDKFDGFSAFSIDDDLDLSHIESVSRSEFSGYKPVPARGLFNAFKRLLGKGGWDNKPEYKDVEYVSMDEIFGNLLAPCNTHFDETMKDTVAQAGRSVEQVKERTRDILLKLDAYIKNHFAELKESLANADTLRKQAELARKNYEQIQSILDTVEHMLDLDTSTH